MSELANAVERITQRLQNMASHSLKNGAHVHPSDVMEIAQQIRDTLKEHNES